LAFASFTLIIVGIIESSLEMKCIIACDGLLRQWWFVGQH
jgi:hypothetical protein